MSITADQLKEVLVSPGHVSEQDFLYTAEVALKSKTTVEFQLVTLGLISDYNLAKTIADSCEYTFFDLKKVTIEDRFLEIIPEIVAQEQKAVVYGETEDVLMVATLFPDNFEFQKLLEKKIGKKVQFAYVAQGALTQAIGLYKGDYKKRIGVLVAQCIEGNTEGVVVQLVDLFLEYGHESKASDIHFEPLESKVRIRFRVDGMLHEVITYPRSVHEQISFRVKILSQLQTDERSKPQDGRFSYTQSEGTFDIRVSIIPVTSGENIVMRLLSSSARQYSLESLGFSSDNYEKILHAMQQPHGMILTVGPTGSGKTTVLYSILEHLNTPEVNIMTIEDPVEYDIESVQQTQVNKSKDLLFSTGLRSIVRQDPDIIMVGEIRDEETADISVNAAMTGHLLLSTLHTNDAATTFPRLAEMGVKSFLVATSVRIIVSLRLVRTVCLHCKESYFLSKEEQEVVKSEKVAYAYILEISGKKNIAKIRFYRGVGCKICHKSGFQGRSAIFEVLVIDNPIKVLVSNDATSDEIHQAAVERGMKPLLYDGIFKALSGQTTVEEVIKSTYS
ncbi:MAG: type IV pilus assembly protein PilB [Acidimicrobiales bacterium]|jgi:type IV pilus assembly protein PilB